MKVLFIASGNHAMPSPVVGNQAEALMTEGVEIEWYLLKGKGVKGYMKNVKPLRKHLMEHRYDAVHAHYSLSAFVASLAGAKPLVVSLMGSDVKAAGWYKFIIRLFVWMFRWKAIIVKSNDMCHSLGIKRAIVVPNGVNMERFKPMDKAECQAKLGWNVTSIEDCRLKIADLGEAKTYKKKHVLFPADMKRPEKDFALAEAAVALLQQSIGDRRLNSEDFHGVELHAFENTPNEETPYWYNAADVVLMTSKWEGSPNAIKEAMACSRPIVTTKVGDVEERMSGVDGCFVAQSRNPQVLAELLKSALTYSSTKGRERIIADGLDVHEINQKLIGIYESLNK